MTAAMNNPPDGPWRLPFGRYQGRLLCDVPDGYLTWLEANAYLPRLQRAAQEELIRRSLATARPAPSRDEDMAVQEALRQAQGRTGKRPAHWPPRRGTTRGGGHRG